MTESSLTVVPVAYAQQTSLSALVPGHEVLEMIVLTAKGHEM